MAETQAPLEKLKAAYQAWHDSRGKSIETWLELLADEIDFRSLAEDAQGEKWTARRRSRDEVRLFFLGFTGEFALERHTVDRFVSEGDTVVMIGSIAWRHFRSGRRIESPKVDVWRFEGGKAVAFAEFYDTAKFAEAAAG
jgi:uncharacterized protein